MDALAWTLSMMLLAAACGVLGVLLHVRRQGLVLGAVGHATLPGLGLALLLSGGAIPSQGLLVGSAAATGLTAAWLVSWLSRRPGVRPDAAQAVVLSLAFGAGAVLWSIQDQVAAGTPAGSFDWQPWLFGQVAALDQTDLRWVLGGAGAVLLVVLCVFKQLQLAAFAPEQARMQGLPVWTIDTLVLLATALVAVLAMKAVGLILVLGLFLAPAASGRLLTSRLGPACAAAGLCGALATVLGVIVSHQVPWFPAGPAILLVASGGLWLAGPLRKLWLRSGRRGRPRS